MGPPITTGFPQRLGACRLHGGQPIAQHRGEELHYLPVAIGTASQPTADPFQRTQQQQVLERGAPLCSAPGFLASTGTSCQGGVDRLVAAKAAAVLAD
jgi:hypothetical protein